MAAWFGDQSWVFNGRIQQRRSRPNVAVKQAAPTRFSLTLQNARPFRPFFRRAGWNPGRLMLVDLDARPVPGTRTRTQHIERLHDGTAEAAQIINAPCGPHGNGVAATAPQSCSLSLMIGSRPFELWP